MIFTNKTLCDYGCGRSAIRITKNGKHICSKHHRSCPAVLQTGFNTNLKKYGSKTPAGALSVQEKMKSTTLKKYGVVNASQSDIIKKKKQKTMLDRYGVENPSHLSSVVEKLSIIRKRYWQKVYDNKNFSIEGLNRGEYGRRCHQYAETQYQRYKHLVDPESKRGKHWHVDHVYSVTDGFLNNVPINIISDISNLRLITDKENYSKNRKSEKTLVELYEDFIRSINS